MKVGILGVGTVGRAAALSMVHRDSCAELVLVDRQHDLVDAVALDLAYAAVMGRSVRIRAGDGELLRGCRLVVVDAGTNEKAGGADRPGDPEGRLRLIDANAPLMAEIVPEIRATAPDAVVLVVTNPPDPMADLVRELLGHERVMSSGTYLDSLRFRFHLARELEVSPQSVKADVLGEHGTSEVLHWSAASVGDVPVDAALGQQGKDPTAVRVRVEAAVRGANINIIKGLGASQYGIGAVIARLAEAVLRDEQLVAPVGSFHAGAELTYSLPSRIGAAGVAAVIAPQLDDAEAAALERSVEALRKAASRRRDAMA